MRLAEATLRFFAEQRLEAVPSNYAFGYAYASGNHPKLTRAVEAAVSAHGTLSQQELEQLSHAHLPDAAELVQSVGDDISSQVANVLKFLGGAQESTCAYGNTLERALGELSAIEDTSSLSPLVLAIAEATVRAKRESSILTERLDASLKEIGELKAGLENIRAESRLDALTGLCNRKCFEKEIQRVMQETSSAGDKLCLLMLDIDHFKAFNDTFGHQTGDQVIKLVAQVISHSVGEHDLAARYGGEEFVVALAGTDLEQAAVLAERVRMAVATNKLRKRSSGEWLGRITISVGVAELLPDETLESTIERADVCLYEAKRAGRDRVVCRLPTLGGGLRNAS